MLEHKNYKFIQNLKCEYFPCHKSVDTEDFNCIFCFCPLYYTDDCGGKFTYTKDGIKCCEECSFPHHKNNYALVLEKINDYNKKRGDVIE